MTLGRSLATTLAGTGAGFALGGPFGAALGAGGALLYGLWSARRSRFSAALVKAALSTEGFSQTSPEIHTLTAPYNPETTNWCGLAVQGWIRMASAATNLHPSVTGSPQAKAIIAQFQAAKDAQWYDVSELRSKPSLVQPGMIVVWTRGDPSGWTGHIGMVLLAGQTQAQKDSQSFVTLEGNNAPKVARFDHPLSSTSLLGMGRFNV